jgi:hypothetical protein
MAELSSNIPAKAGGSVTRTSSEHPYLRSFESLRREVDRLLGNFNGGL